MKRAMLAILLFIGAVRAPPHPNGLPASTSPLTTSPTTPSASQCPAPTQCPTPPPCPTLPPPTQCPAPPPCPSTTPPAILPGYSRIADLGCYKFHDTRVSWQTAKEACESEGSHLVIVNSEAEAMAMAKIAQRNGIFDMWVGIRESNTTQHKFFTVLGEPLSSLGFSRWKPGEPSQFLTLGNPVSLDFSRVALDEEDVDLTFRFVCEQRMC